MNRSTRLAPLLVVAVLGAAACGGGKDARQALSGDDSVAATSSSAPVVTDAPAATAPPSTDPPVTEPSTTDASLGEAAASGAFCAASAKFFVEATALSEIGPEDNAAAERLFDQMQQSLPVAVSEAPTEAQASAPKRAAELFEILIPALDTLGYTFDELATLDNAAEVGAAFSEFAALVEGLEGFLETSCDSDIPALEADAVELGASVGSVTSSTDVPSSDVPTTDEPVPDFGDLPPGTVRVIDDTGTISLAVPTDWVEVDGTPDGDFRQLVAAPDNDAFLAAFDSPGVIIISGDAVGANGAAAADAGLDGVVASVEAEGCTQQSSTDYDDGVYVGTELIYSCPGTDAVSRFAGGTNGLGTVFWLLGVIYEPGGEQIWNDITDTFLVD